MSLSTRLDKISTRIRARLSKQRPLRRAQRGRNRNKRPKPDPHTIMRELRHIAGLRPHYDIDVTQATFLYGTVLGHALGRGAISEKEYVQLINCPD